MGNSVGSGETSESPEGLAMGGQGACCCPLPMLRFGGRWWTPRSWKAAQGTHGAPPEPHGTHREQAFKGKTVTLKNKNSSNKSLLWLRA